MVTDAKGLTSDRFAAIVTASNSAGHAAAFTPAPIPPHPSAAYNAAVSTLPAAPAAYYGARYAAAAAANAASAKALASIIAAYGLGRS